MFWLYPSLLNARPQRDPDPGKLFPLPTWSKFSSFVPPSQICFFPLSLFADEHGDVFLRTFALTGRSFFLFPLPQTYPILFFLFQKPREEAFSQSLRFLAFFLILFPAALPIRMAPPPNVELPTNICKSLS